jgi:predicted nucleic-acid-binding protein
MTGLDANILVRYFAQDDTAQSRVATEIIEGRLTEADPGFISLVAIAETAWVLRRSYRLSDLEIASAIEFTLESEVLVVQSKHEVADAMLTLKEGRGSFADALVGALNASAGCSRTLTFDRKALGLPGFEHP